MLPIEWYSCTLKNIMEILVGWRDGKEQGEAGGHVKGGLTVVRNCAFPIYSCYPWSKNLWNLLFALSGENSATKVFWACGIPISRAFWGAQHPGAHYKSIRKTEWQREPASNEAVSKMACGFGKSEVQWEPEQHNMILGGMIAEELRGAPSAEGPLYSREHWRTSDDDAILKHCTQGTCNLFGELGTQTKA